LPPKGKTPRPGIIVGGFPRHSGAIDYLTYSNAGHVLCLGPTRSGKTASTMKPTLLTWPHSVIVYDPKGETWRDSAGWRHKEAHNIVLRFAPAELHNTIAWNPFEHVRRGTPFEFRDVANIITPIADPHGKGPTDHWEPSAANLLVGVALFLGTQPCGCTLTGCLTMIDGPAHPQTGVQAWLTAMAQHSTPQIAQVGNGLLATASRERASIISTARRLLAIYRDPVVAKNTAHSDFRIADLMDADRPVSLYIETRGEDELRLRPLVRLFLWLAIGQLISNTEPHRRPLIAAIDEVASLGQMEPLEMMLSKSAGSDVYGLLLTQDRADILAAYGPNERITANCHVLVAHAPNNADTARWLSTKTGQTTVVTEEVSEAQSSGSQRSQNRSYRSVARPVLTPDEVSRLRLPVRDAEGQITGPGETLIFQAGQHVIRGVQSLGFLDPEYRRRMAIPAPATMRAVSRSSVVDTGRPGPGRTHLS
jgi:type IV secretion system protein VirD4